MDGPSNQMGLLRDHFDISILGRLRDDGDDSRSGSENIDGVSGDEQDVAGDQPPRKKKYHRHTPCQIQELELFFKECPHPDEKQRAELSRRLGLETKQIKFWFQNRRTQLKTQLERHENAILRQENDKLRVENELLKQAYAEPVCHSCGGPAVPIPISFEHEQLRIENARLKHDLRHVCSVSNKLLSKPAASPSTSPLPPFGLSSKPNLAVWGNECGGLGDVESKLPIGLDYNDSLLVPPVKSLITAYGYEASYEKSALFDLALAAMDELMKKAQVDGPLWMKTLSGTETLNQEEYMRAFTPCTGVKPSCFVTEATRETGMLIISGLAVVEILMDMNLFVEAFPAFVARASTIDVIADGMGGTKNGVLQVVLAEFQVVSPLVPVRQVRFLRFCKQHSENVWAVVDVSVDANENISHPLATCRRLPSGCIIQEMPDGCCKVTWVEHSEYNDSGVHQLFRPVLSSGRGFGAQRWITALRRYCECLALMSSTSTNEDQSVLSLEGKKSMLKLAHRMVDNFCSGVCASSLHEWEKLQVGNLSEEVRFLTRKSTNDPGEPSGVVLSAATSVWLPATRKSLFDYLRDDSFRSHWDILFHGGSVQEMVHVAKAQEYGNCVSLLRASGADNKVTDGTMLILQETCNDLSSSLMVYAPVDAAAMRSVVNGGDSTYVALLPSGFMITPYSSPDNGSQIISSGAPVKRDDDAVADEGGSILTIGFQILVSSLPSAKLTAESVETVNTLISCTIQRIKSALQLS